MKRYILFIGLLLSFNNLIAQKKVTKTQSSVSINEVYVHLKFAENIIVKNWNKKTISVEATVNLNNNEDNDSFSLQTDKIGNTYKVKSDYGDYFKKRRVVIKDDNGKKVYSNCNNEMTVNYVIYVPKNMELKIKSISGGVEIDSYEGELNLDLISGNITVKKHSDKMTLKTISGDIDVFVSDATFEAKTLNGGIYSDLEIDFDKNKKSGYGSKITATIKKGTASLKLNTISGDIFLRKI